ncbi:MAG: TonB-dependent receptor [bacterium]
MLKRLPTAVLLALVVGLFTLSPGVMAGVSGKISGEVVDSESGEPIVGATVRIVGTNLATKTDADGEYFIINLPIGKHDLAVSSVGYESITKKDVRVLVDLTTPVDFEVGRVAVELGQNMVVYAEEPIIKHDLTESKIIYTSDRLKNLPNIVSVQSVLTNYPGVVVGKDDRLHVRGGRSGQVAFYFDGFSVQDPFFSTAGIRIMPSSLEELSLSSGGFTAEYGEALSGIVSAVTRDGGSQYHGGLRVYEGVTHPYNVTKGTWGGLDRVGNRSMAFNLSGPIPGMNHKSFTFFTAGEFLTDATYLPHNDGTSYTWVTKLSMQPSPKMKFKTNFTYYDASGELYDHRDVNGVSYDFNLDGLNAFRRDAYLAGATGTFNFNESVILTTTVNRFSTHVKTAPEHLMDVHWSKWPGYEETNGAYTGWIQDSNYLGAYDASNPYNVSGFTVGNDYDPTFSERRATYNSLGVNLMAQLNKVHQIKTGFQLRRYRTDWDAKQFFNTNPYGETYSNSPMLASAFFQDKMEYRDFIINAGLRLDYRNADISYNVTPRETVATFKEADAKTSLSPRLGVSFPISQRSMMYFNYGYYYQVPQYDYMFTNLQGDISSGLPLLGNPDLNPEQTISYELGLDHLLSNELHLDVTAYYKDISDLVTTRSTYKVAGNAVTFFDNGDYGSVKGFDVALEKLARGGHFSGSVSYGYMIATGNGSTAMDPYYTYLTSTSDTLAPVTEYPLDFDQRHTVTAVLDYRVPRNWKGSFVGLTIPGAWGLNMVGHYGSGLPYTPTDAFGNRLSERNDGRLPANYTVDMRFNKDLFLGGASDYNMTFFVEVDNLFDRHNVINVYSRTGRPDDDGNRAMVGQSSTYDQQELDRLDQLFDRDPQNYSPPRTVRVGLELTF